jgi:hypothetical protein
MDLNRIVVGGSVMGFWRKTILDLGQMEAYKRRGELVQSIRFSTTTYKFEVLKFQFNWYSKLSWFHTVKLLLLP